MTEAKKATRGTTKADLKRALEAQQAEMDRLRTMMEEQSKLQTALIASQLGAKEARPRIAPGQQVVGIRNISNHSVGITDRTGMVTLDYSLAPSSETHFVPQSQATISYAFWQQLRHGKMVRDGMLIRDDSILTEQDFVGPADGPNDLPPEAAQNQIPAPRKWIAETPEAEVRARIKAITSTPTLRRILRTVDEEVFAIGERLFKDDPDRATKAVDGLPAAFTLAENLAKSRLDELEPMTKDPAFIRNLRH